jgi:hypothetical protein
MNWEDMQVGQQVRFVKFTGTPGTLNYHDHWAFTPGGVYHVVDRNGCVGPADDEGDVPNENWGFEFEINS